MKKIYFASTPWGNTYDMVKNVIEQTPQENGIWKNITFTYDKDEADFILVQDHTTEIVDPAKVLFFGREPKHVLNGFGSWIGPCYGNFHHENQNSWLPQNWWVKIPYDKLKTLVPTKEKDLSIIDSGKRLTSYHNFRVDLINLLVKNYAKKFDLYGQINNNPLPHRDKTNGLINYRYNLAIENGRTDFYFSEKIIDPIILLTMPIYSGCKQIQKFLPKGSYIEFRDDKGIEYATEQIIEISKSNYREENLHNLVEARELILEKYNIWPTLYKAIHEKIIL